MKKYFFVLFLLPVLLATGNVALCQTRPTKSKVVFVEDSLPSQLLRFINGISKVEEKIEANTKLVNDFTAVYDGLSGKQRQQVVELYNAARKTKMDPMPDYVDMTRTLIAYRGAKVSTTIFDEWVAATTAIMSITNKTKEITGFIKYTSDLLQDRTLYKSRTSIWRAQAGSVFSFVPIRNDIKTVFSGTVNLTYISGTGNMADENTIYGTTGVYYFLTDSWEGRGGRLTWERCGLSPEVCHADLRDYSVSAKLPKFTADSVTFINSNYFKTSILGVVDEALSTKTEPEKYNFPKFRSYQKDFQLKDVLPGVDFEGNFMMYGPRFVTNDEKNPASMIFYRNGKRFLVVSSTKFAVLPNMLTSERAAVKMYIGDDSICNAGVLLSMAI